MEQYALKKTIRKHHDSINALAFSLDGSLFASGADDGLIIVFRGGGSGKEVRRFQVKAPIATLLWRSRFGYTVVAGDTSGDVHTISLDGSATRNLYYHTINAVSGPVHCIAQSDAWLAIGSGKVVQLVKQATIATWERVGLLPDPPKFPELEGELPEPVARSLHFLGGGSDVLLVTYLDHGVIAWNLTTLEIKWRIRPRSCKIGCSAVSPNEKLLAVTNLYDGIDWYALNGNHFMDTSFQHTTTHPIHENVIHPLTFIHGNAGVLSGTSYGCARITTVKDWSLLERLQHDPGDIVQAVAYSYGGDARQILTGVSERGMESVIRYWIQENSQKKRAEPRPQTAAGGVRPYLGTHWHKLAFKLTTTIIICSLGIFLATAQWDGHTLSVDRTQAWLSLSLIGRSSSHSIPIKSQQQDWEWVRDGDKWVRKDIASDSDMPGHYAA